MSKAVRFHHRLLYLAVDLKTSVGMISTIANLISNADMYQMDIFINLPDMIISSLGGNLPPNSSQVFETKSVNISVVTGNT